MKDKRNWGKEIKHVGVLIIVIGAVMLCLVFYLLTAYNGGSVQSQSPFYQLVDKHFVLLIIGGLLMLLAGIIIRSIGRSKELKFYKKNGMNPNQPYYQNQPNSQYNPYQQSNNLPVQQNNDPNNQ